MVGGTIFTCLREGLEGWFGVLVVGFIEAGLMLWLEGCILLNGFSGLLVSIQVRECGGLHLEEIEYEKRGIISQEGGEHVLRVMKKTNSGEEHEFAW